MGEASTKDGTAPDALSHSVPGLAGGSNAVIRVEGRIVGTTPTAIASTEQANGENQTNPLKKNPNPNLL